MPNSLVIIKDNKEVLCSIYATYVFNEKNYVIYTDHSTLNNKENLYVFMYDNNTFNKVDDITLANKVLESIKKMVGVL